MKRFLALLLLCTLSSVTFAHQINGYKYILLERSGNTYNIEKRLKTIFTEIGFTVIDQGDDDDFSVSEKKLVLNARYGFDINYGYPSVLTVVLINYRGQEIYKSQTTGNSLTASGDMSNALYKFQDNLEDLNYKFEEKRVNKTRNYDVNCSEWGEDSTRTYLTSNKILPVEGIYKSFQNDGSFCRFALIQENEKLYGVILESDNNIWDEGDIRIVMEHIEGELYDAEYYNTDKVKLNCVASYKDRILTVQTSSGSTAFLKTFPSSKTSMTSSDSQSSQSSSTSKEASATGSGFLISEKVFATNFHVIDGAEHIEICLATDEGSSSYNAKVLAIDKVNDIALLIIKDPNYKSLGNPPYGIISSTADVGTSIFTMGFPMTDLLGSEIKVTDGIVSSKTGFKNDISQYQISAPITHGNSGGPLFDKNGNLIGITCAGFEGADNTNYAIKTNYLLSLIESAPIEINLNSKRNNNQVELPFLIKNYRPYIALVKVW